MRTTLNVEDDLLIALREIAKRESRSLGAVVSKLLRQQLTVRSASAAVSQAGGSEGEFGFRPFPKRGGIVTNAMIDRLRNEMGD